MAKKTPTKKRPPKQGKIPGTERKEIEELTEAAEALRIAKADRADHTAKVHDAQAHLDATISRLVDHGAITLPDQRPLDKWVIYTYDREDGKVEDVRYSSSSKSDTAENKGKSAE